MSAFRTEGVAIVTGAAHGIGQGATFALAEAGATAIVFVDVDKAGAQKSAEISKTIATNSLYRTKVVALDVTDASAVRSTFQQVASEFGRLDYLVNSAGIDVREYTKITNNDLSDFDHVMAVNTKGSIYCAKAAIEIMENQEPREMKTRNNETRVLDRGAIVNVTSALSFMAVKGKLAYITSKHASVGVTKSLATDVAGDRIRVNAICPTWVRTPMWENEKKKAPGTEDAVKHMVPIGRVAEPDEVGNGICYLLSPAASYVNGTALAMDAGMLLTVHMGV